MTMRRLDHPRRPPGRLADPVSGRSHDVPWCGPKGDGERGVALVVVLLAVFLIAALAMSLALTMATETIISAGYRDASEATYAAEAGLERALLDLRGVGDWTVVLTSPDDLHASAASTFLGASLSPVLPDGRALDLRRATSMANCPQVSPAPSSCSLAQVQAAAGERRWGANNPHWRLFAHGRLSDLLPGRADSPFDVAVWTADDPAETDEDASSDGGPGRLDLDGDGVTDRENPGRGILQVRAEAFGPGGVRRVLEATVARVDRGGAARGYAGQRGLNERSSHSRRSAVQAHGSVLTTVRIDRTRGLVREP